VWFCQYWFSFTIFNADGKTMMSEITALEKLKK
jgi:hypothetical protein